MRDNNSSPCCGAAARRRTVLKALGLTGAGAATLAGCGPADGGFSDEVAAGKDGGVPLAEIAENSARVVAFGKERVVVVRGSGDEVRGLSAYCTHQGCVVAASDDGLTCPCHHSTFETATGKATGGPAKAPLPPVKLSVSNGVVQLA
ncbi:QcrA and Rieske domain-containing protein [Dermabacteraceae bacterium P7074]